MCDWDACYAACDERVYPAPRSGVNRQKNVPSLAACVIISLKTVSVVTRHNSPPFSKGILLYAQKITALVSPYTGAFPECVFGCQPNWNRRPSGSKGSLSVRIVSVCPAAVSVTKNACRHLPLLFFIQGQPRHFLVHSSSSAHSEQKGRLRHVDLPSLEHDRKLRG